MPVERKNLWTDVFQRDLQDGFDPTQASENRQARAARRSAAGGSSVS